MEQEVDQLKTLVNDLFTKIEVNVLTWAEQFRYPLLVPLSFLNNAITFQEYGGSTVFCQIDL